MITKVTTREYDSEGRLAREVVTEYDMTPGCTCGPNMWCNLHQRYTGPWISTNYPPIYSSGYIQSHDVKIIPATAGA